jgi:hypothetical protein
MKWKEYTWYSKWASLLFFIVVLPILSFYIGMQYEVAKQPLENQLMQAPATNTVTDFPSQATLETYVNEKYGFEFKYPSGLAYEERMLNGKDIVIDFSYGNPGYALTITVSPIDDHILASGQEPSYYEKETNELVTYDSVNKKKVILREKPSISQNGWDGFYVFITLVIPNKRAG